MPENLKKHLIAAMESLLADRIEKLNNDLKSSKGESAEQFKNSAGDKHEVGRAMANIEIEKLAQQIELNKRMLFDLKQLNPRSTNQVSSGSLIETNKGDFYVSVGLGKVELDNRVFFAASVASPLISALIGKKEGDSVLFNGITYEINRLL